MCEYKLSPPPGGFLFLYNVWVKEIGYPPITPKSPRGINYPLCKFEFDMQSLDLQLFIDISL